MQLNVISETYKADTSVCFCLLLKLEWNIIIFVFQTIVRI